MFTATAELYQHVAGNGRLDAYQQAIQIAHYTLHIYKMFKLAHILGDPIGVMFDKAEQLYHRSFTIPNAQTKETTRQQADMIEKCAKGAYKMLLAAQMQDNPVANMFAAVADAYRVAYTSDVDKQAYQRAIMMEKCAKGVYRTMLKSTILATEGEPLAAQFGKAAELYKRGRYSDGKRVEKQAIKQYETRLIQSSHIRHSSKPTRKTGKQESIIRMNKIIKGSTTHRISETMTRIDNRRKKNMKKIRTTTIPAQQPNASALVGGRHKKLNKYKTKKVKFLLIF
jgi:hypothetical protein